MKISYVIGIGVTSIVLMAAVLNITSTDNSGNEIRVAFFPSISHAVPIVGIENNIFQENLTEQKIQYSINNLMKNKTTFVIAHRLSTIEDADIIYVLD